MYRVRGVTEAGDPVDLFIAVCWRCGLPVVTNLVDMAEHVDRMHPVPEPRHAMGEPRTVPSMPLPELGRNYPGEPAP